MINVEVCIDNIESLYAAQRAGAGRIELCSSLTLGGLTPSSGLITQVVKHAAIPVYTMIRPRDGDFLYSSDEVEIMLCEIHHARSLGVQGVVLGLLNQQAEIDKDILKSLMQESRGLGVTFHRAIDCCVDAELAVETVISAGCERILTSGSAKSAELGCESIKRMVKQADGRLSIMAGAGINANNVATIVKATGIQEVHLSGKTVRSSYMQKLINCGYLPEFMIMNVTSSEKVDGVKQALLGF
ncbi:MAG: copper homeostasis protein CutC [Psychromonas sp.]|nr:copper homeostasis protein CutC [Alteromonadales bacterium]MCP5077094.1 copper homeostasis protein CutC [Psychromonas sp.]